MSTRTKEGLFSYKSLVVENPHNLLLVIPIIIILAFLWSSMFNNNHFSRNLYDRLDGLPNIKGVWMGQKGWQPTNIIFYPDRTAEINWGFDVDVFNDWQQTETRIRFISNDGSEYCYNYKYIDGNLIIRAGNEQWIFKKSQ